MTSYVTPLTKKIEKTQKLPKIKSQKKYRGRGKVNQRDSTFSVLLTNIRGYKSKKVSLQKIVKKVRPSMVLLNETQLVNKMSVSLDTYLTWTKNRTEKGGGGIATAVSQNFRNLAIGAGEEEKEDEYIITRIEAFSPPLTVVNNYGEQRVTKKEEVEEKWARLKGDLEEIRSRG